MLIRVRGAAVVVVIHRTREEKEKRKKKKRHVCYESSKKTERETYDVYISAFFERKRK